ncbi:MAG: hypothetical protein JXB26_19390 [Candidatus Aminicenantes bacterium]|nr:hypothetical protein [Candidatus Aminicenantes bacterium]
MKFNGKEYTSFRGAFNTPEYSSCIVGCRGASPIPCGKSKVTSLDAVMEHINDGCTISYPHYYRSGDLGLKLIVEKLREKGKKDIKIYGNAFFDNNDPWLIDAFRSGTLSGLYGNIYRKIGEYVMNGELLPWVTVGFSHGNRVRKLQTGEVHVDVAFAPVPIADIYGNANGIFGKEEQLCGPLGLVAADSEYADFTCLMAGTVSEEFVVPISLSMTNTDFVVPVDTPGLASGIGSGTLNLEKAKSHPFNARVGENVTAVLKAAGVVKDGFNFQVGSGAGLIVLDNIRKMLKADKKCANFAMGGVTSLHVDMLNEGTISTLLHGQLFEPSRKVIDSMRENSHHIEITAGYYASVANKENAVNALDLAVLSALEVDLDFNLNTVCANGRIIGGIGGGQDVAAGSELTIIFLPLATGKNGKGFPKVVEKVYTRTTPGEVVDVIVTEEYISVNPKSSTPAKESILENGKTFGLQIVPIEELHQRSLTRARELGRIPEIRKTTEEVLHVIEWRDGTLLDVIRRLLTMQAG